MSKQQWMDELVKDFVKQLEEGTAPWINPLVESNCMPMNYKSRRMYKGVNVLLLWMKAEQEGFTTPYWMTFKQCKLMGGNVIKGSVGQKIVFFEPKEIETDGGEEEEQEKRYRWITRSYTVFNIEQTDLSQPEKTVSDYDKAQARHPLADDFIERTRAHIIRKKGLRPAYHPKKDLIYIPVVEEYENHDEWYATIFHELSHWSGHSTRLSRITLGKLGTSSYGYEELIAELSAAFLCSYLNIPLEKNQHPEYLANWAAVIGAKPNILFKAANQASVAFEYLKDLAQPEVQDTAVNE